MSDAGEKGPHRRDLLALDELGRPVPDRLFQRPLLRLERQVELASVEKVLDAKEGLDLVERLGHEVLGAGSERAMLGLHGHVGRQDENRQVLVRGNHGLELPEHTNPVEVRHQQVEQDQVGPERLVELQDTAGVRRALEVPIPGGLEQPLEQPDIGRLIVDDQDLRRGRFVWHGLPSRKEVGGGINAGTANLTNCTVSGNSAGDAGGGIAAGSATLLNCTVVENIAHTGGGLFHGAGGTFNVRNTIVALNLVDFTGTGPDVSGDFASQGHNLIGDPTDSTGFTNAVNGDRVGTSANPIDPKLGPLANNGGRTKTHALLAGSPAIDHGDYNGAPPTDQRGFGFARKKDGNGDGIAIVDIGAFEK